MGTVVLAIGCMLLFSVLALVRRRWYDRLEAPVWILEDRVFSAFERLTGGSRRTLRQLLIAVAVLATAVAMGLTMQMGALERSISSAIVVGVMLIMAVWVDATPSLFSRTTTLGFVLAYLYEGVSAGVGLQWDHMTYCLAVGLVRLTDYILWADKRTKRKRRMEETLPERFLRRIREAGFSPAADKA